MTDQGKMMGFSMSFGGQRTTTPKFAPKTKTSAVSKRIHFGDDDDVDDEPKAEAVTGFEDNKIKRLHEPEKKKEIVIPSLPNTDFRREAASRRSLYLPESGLHGQQNAGPTQPEVLGQQVTQFGLQVTKKTTTTENGSSDMQVEETVITEQETTVPTQTLEETALAALIREAQSNGEEEEQASTLVIPNELDVFRHDVQSRPEETTLEEYEEVPVEQFGAALLRGMGWKEGQSLGGGKAGTSEPLAAKNFVRRDALLGLGAKPEDVSASERKNRRSAYEFSETSLFVKKSKDNGSRTSSRSGTPADDTRTRARSRSRSPPRHRSRSPPRRSRRDDDRSPKRSKRDRSRSGERSRRRDDRRRDERRYERRDDRRDNRRDYRSRDNK